MSAKLVGTVGVFIGCFQPFHIGHKTVIDAMIKEVDIPIVIIGSSDLSPSVLNPFSYSLRYTMLKEMYPNLIIMTADDYKYQDGVWIGRIKQLISTFEYVSLGPGGPSKQNPVVIYGCHKDGTSEYLDWFPEYKYKEIDSGIDLSSTDIRNLYFQYLDKTNFDGQDWDETLPKSSIDVMRDFTNTDEFKRLKDEFFYIKRYKKDTKFVGIDFPPIFVATDALVVCGGNILLVVRGGSLGNNQVAMPGGFLNADESINNGLFRELKEETKIDVPQAILRNSLKTIEVFDDPRRSLRGRTITHCGLIVLREKKLPKVKGSDDAKEAFWLPINRIENIRDRFFEDHYFVIKKMLTHLS